MAMSDWEVPPPATVTVIHEHRPTLFLADGTPLVRTAGFTSRGQTMQASGTYPQLNTGKTPKGGKKGGKKGTRGC